MKGERPAEPYKPFFESLEYDGSFIGLTPSFRETLVGRFSLGEHPELPWLNGITVQLLLVFLVASAAPTLLVLARNSQKKQKSDIILSGRSAYPVESLTPKPVENLWAFALA